MTRPSEPPVARMVGESCSWHTRAVCPCKSARQFLWKKGFEKTEHEFVIYFLTLYSHPIREPLYPALQMRFCPHQTQRNISDGSGRSGHGGILPYQYSIAGRRKLNEIRLDMSQRQRTVKWSTNPAGSVVTAAHDFVSAYIQAAHTLGMALKHTKHFSALDIPYTQRCVTRACYSNWSIVQHADATNRRSVTA